MRPGDFLEVNFARSFRYLRYFGKYSKAEPFDIFGVLSSDCSEPKAPECLARCSIDYFMTASAGVFQRDSRFRVVKGARIEWFDIPVFRQRYGIGWHLKEPGGDRLVRELDDTSRNLPIFELIPADVLIERLETGWLPRDDTLDSTQWFARAIAKAQKSGWKGFEQVEWTIDVGPSSPTPVILSRLKNLALDASVKKLNDQDGIVVTVTPPPGVDIVGEWLDDVERKLTENVKDLGGFIVGHQLK